MEQTVGVNEKTSKDNSLKAEIDRLKSENERLKKDNNQLSTLIESVPGVMFIADISSLNYEFISSYSKTLLEYTPEEFYEDPDIRVSPHILGLVELVSKVEDMLLDGMVPPITEMTIITKSGKRKWARQHTTVVYKKDTPSKLVGIMYDLSDRQLIEQRITESKELLDRALEAAKGAVWDFDLVKNSMSFSERFYNILGYKFSEINSGKCFLDSHIHPQDKDKIANYFGNIKSKNIEFEFRLKNSEGRWLWFLAILKIECDKESEKPQRAIGVLVNITQSKHLFEELQKAAKLESIGILAGGIAHDFNNMLMGISGNIALARSMVDPVGKISKILSNAETAANRATGLTQQLLTFAKGGLPIIKDVDVSQILIEAASFILSGSDVECNFKIAQDLWHVKIDSGQITMVVHNIIINAAQAMPNGGTIYLYADNCTLNESSNYLACGNYVKVEIKDSGHGINYESLDKIFDPYYSTKEEGRGLGLAVVYSIIKKHNGYITAESEPGVGSRFIFLSSCFFKKIKVLYSYP